MCEFDEIVYKFTTVDQIRNKMLAARYSSDKPEYVATRFTPALLSRMLGKYAMEGHGKKSKRARRM